MAEPGFECIQSLNQPIQKFVSGGGVLGKGASRKYGELETGSQSEIVWKQLNILLFFLDDSLDSSDKIANEIIAYGHL